MSSYLPITEIANVRRSGFDHGYKGGSALSCPYVTGYLRDAWLSGHTVGKQQRCADHRDGTSPDLVGRTEFQAEPAGSIRRGGVGGSK